MGSRNPSSAAEQPVSHGDVSAAQIRELASILGGGGGTIITIGLMIGDIDAKLLQVGHPLHCILDVLFYHQINLIRSPGGVAEREYGYLNMGH